MEIETTPTRRSLHSPLICHICGDIARGMNFDVLTCMSCKAFFRRHALRSIVSENFIYKKIRFLFSRKISIVYLKIIVI